MKINIAICPLKSGAFVAVTLLVLNASFLPAFSLPASPDLTWTAQRGPMMGPGGQDSGNWGCCSHYGRMYDPKTVETVSGEIVSVATFTPQAGMGQGIHLQLKTAKETIDVHLGPAWYLQNQNLQLQAKDKIAVTGSRISFNGQPAIIAAEVRKGSATLKLRDSNGVPYWSGGRPNQPN